MATVASGSIKVSLDVKLERKAVAGALLMHSLSSIVDPSPAWVIAAGIAAGGADRVWANRFSILTGATEILDLATGGNLVDDDGAPVVIVKLRAVVLAAPASNTTTITLARPAANGVPLFGAASGALAPLSAGGSIHWKDPAVGVVVVAGSADLLHLINSAGATALADIALVGTSA